jgi:hypothetical protein
MRSQSLARFFTLSILSTYLATAAPVSLSNPRITAEFDERGLVALTDREAQSQYRFSHDGFSITLSGQKYKNEALPAPTRQTAQDRVIYSYTAGSYGLDIVYEVRPDWHFVSKQLVIRSAPDGNFTLGEIQLFDTATAETPQEDYVIDRAKPALGTRSYGAFLRFPGSGGLLITAQNPFLEYHRNARIFSLSYQPEMEWNRAWGRFETDRGLIAPYRSHGPRLSKQMIPEWHMSSHMPPDGMDTAEVETFTNLVRSFLLYKPQKPANIMVGWCVNDYQIDVGTEAGRTEYERIFDMASELGADHVLFAPANSNVSRLEDSTDDWGWEFTLWLGLGQKIRRNEWSPANGPIPPSVKEMLDYAGSKNLHLLAYVYPVLGFAQNPNWLLSGGGRRANLGVHSFQDWLIKALEDFKRHTGISGYSFDHTFLTYEGTSKYAQWWGWRRVMESLRRDIPDIVIDGRQAYHLYGPWSWLAGTYPHPTANDEQPESFTSFPDLHFDRVSADRERYTAYRYRNYEFAPSEVVPGFITHQTARNDETGHMPQARDKSGAWRLLPYRQRDWDYLGWRYSLLSSIAIAGWNNVLNMIPARDIDEFKNFSEADRRWFRKWIEWTNTNKEYLRHTRTILGQPAIGKTDGTAAVQNSRGYIFLFNPNGRRLPADFELNESIGLSKQGNYILRELHPAEGMLLGKPDSGFWKYGDSVHLEMDGGSARVFEVEPAPESIREPMLFNAAGSAAFSGGAVQISGVRGEPGTTENLLVALPSGAKATSVTLNGRETDYHQSADALTVPVTWNGEPFRHYQQIDEYRAGFTGGIRTANLRVPQRIFKQLEDRRKAWPIPWTSDDLRSTWLAPERLLLYAQLVEPDEHWNASLKIDGVQVDLVKAFASVRSGVKQNFVGFYADVSAISPDQDHKIELQLPTGLKPGQFQGIFIENVESEYTSERRR